MGVPLASGDLKIRSAFADDKEDCMIDFDEWSDYASDEELDALESAAKKSMWKWLLISLIPIVGIFIIGCAIFAYNNYHFIESRGESMGSDVVRGIMMLWGLFIIPLIVLKILSSSNKLGDKVLGWDKIDYDEFD